MNKANGTYRSKCSLQRCRNFGQRLEAGPDFTCSMGHECPILYPAPPKPLWKWKSLWFGLVMLIAGSATAGYFKVKSHVADLNRPRITALDSTEDVKRGEPWDALVKAEGREPLRYQWYRGLPGDTDDPVSEGVRPKLSIAAATTDETFWVRVSNEFGTSDSQSIRAEPRYVVESIDYRRELTEALALAREILDKATAAHVSREQLDEAFVPIPNDQRDRWTNLLNRAEDRQQAASYDLTEKLEYLATLDQDHISEALDNWAIFAGGIEGERQQKALSLLRNHWLKARSDESLSAIDLIDASNALAPNY